MATVILPTHPHLEAMGSPERLWAWQSAGPQFRACLSYPSPVSRNPTSNEEANDQPCRAPGVLEDEAHVWAPASISACLVPSPSAECPGEGV